MSPRFRARRTCLAVLVSSAVACAEASEPRPEAATTATTTLVARDTLVTTASGLIGSTRDIAAAPDGRVFVSDAFQHRVLSLAPDGSDPVTIGREGSGPGELNTPRAIAASADTVWVYDLVNARVQAFDRAGRPGRSYGVEVPSRGLPSTLDRQGRLTVGTRGNDGALLRVFDGVTVRTIGEVPPDRERVISFADMREVVMRGEIPVQLRNHVVPAVGADGSIYVAFSASPEVRRYGPDGVLMWTRTLSDPLLEAARASFVRRNTENDEPSRRFFPLDYVTDAQVLGAELWLLLNPGDAGEGAMLVLDAADGATLRKISLPDLPSAGAFVVDDAGRRLYVVLPEEVMLVGYAVE